MKGYIATLLIGLIAGGFIVYKLFPQRLVETKTEVKDKIVTVVKQVRAKDGSVTKTVTRTEDKVSLIAVPDPKRKYMAGIGATLSGTYEATLGMRAFDNVWVTVGADSNKTVRAGILVEF